jgi:hypothetical protein
MPPSGFWVLDFGFWIIMDGIPLDDEAVSGGNPKSKI